MLETVSSYIESLPCISFEEHFMNYIFEVQDTSIDLEVQFAIRNNFLDINSVNRIINSYYRSSIVT